MNDKDNSPRERVTRLVQVVPEPWMADLLPVLLRVVVVCLKWAPCARQRRSVGTEDAAPLLADLQGWLDEQTFLSKSLIG